MIALIPELQGTLACWRSPDNAPVKDTFAQILENEAARANPPGPPPLPTYEVQAGDNLWTIAKKLHVADPRQLARLNSLQNPDLLKVGQVLTLPRETSTSPADSCPQAVDQKRMAGGQPTPKRVLPPAQVTTATGKGQMVTASWYGPQHHGKLMANGRPFDMQADTAAHRTLPFGTRLRLTNPANGRSVEVRITDRGPFIPGRSLDLSYSAAQKLGVVKAGVSRLYLEQS
jgi:peptidoglycan lytic transglycosylase